MHKGYAIYTPGMILLEPHTMGQPNENQGQGSDLERLLEYSCRICYDSMGAKTSRDSKSLHEHMQDAPNLSVYEHAWLTLEIEGDPQQMLGAVVNRKGLFVSRLSGNSLTITANLRAILEWSKWTKKLPDFSLAWYRDEVGDCFLDAFKKRMPMALSRWNTSETFDTHYEVIEQLNNFERPISCWLRGSRGFSHEAVRHRENMSQRSTRFVDELPPNWNPANPVFIEEERCEGEYVWHPLLLKYLKDENIGAEERHRLKQTVLLAREQDRVAYADIIRHLQDYAISKGMDKLAARKQGRGAARGSLGNALATELIFTASVDSWKNIFDQRGGAMADAEIRQVVVDVLGSFSVNPILKDYFSCYQVKWNKENDYYIQSS